MAVRFATDENFNRDILRGLLRRRPDLDVLRVQDAKLRGADDPFVLTWAAEEDRILLTHDRQTMPPFAYDRIAAGLAMPGMIVVEQRMSVGRAIDELLMLMDTTPDPLWYDQVHHLSLR